MREWDVVRVPAVVVLGSIPLLVAAVLALRVGPAGGAAVVPRTEVVVLTDAEGATIRTADGGAREGLAWLLPGDRDVAISPDGRRVAFSSERDGNREIYVGDVVTGSLVRLTRSAGRTSPAPRWP